MSQSATPATQNDMTTCFETSKKEMFCSFPHRHGEATGKPETRDETRGSIKTNISCETSASFHSWRPTKRRGFAASPQENQRLNIILYFSRTIATQYRLVSSYPLLYWFALNFDIFYFAMFELQELWTTEGYWSVDQESRQLVHISGQKVALPAEMPAECDISESQLCYKATVGAGLVSIPCVKILQKDPAARAQIEAPFWLEACPNDAQAPSSPASTLTSTSRSTETPRPPVHDDDEAIRRVPPPPSGFGGSLGSAAWECSLGTSKFATSKSMFRARLPSIFSTSHKMPRLPRNLHLVATWRSPANAIRKKHATRHV